MLNWLGKFLGKTTEETSQLYAQKGLQGQPQQPPGAMEAGKRDLVDFLAPGGMVEREDSIVFPGEGVVRIWYVQDLPTEMPREALDAIYDFPGEIRISMLARTMNKEAVRAFLKQQRTLQHADLITRAQKGMVADYAKQADLAEVEQTLRELQITHRAPVELCWTIGLWGQDEEELEEQSRRLEDLMRDADLTFFRAALRQERGLYSVQPFGVNFLGESRNVDVGSLAGMFPFARRTWTDPKGVPYGIDRTTGAWVIVDDFSLPNFNMLVIGEQGSGKSMFLKYKATWAVLLGMRCFIIDLEGEYEPMCAALGGTYLDMSLTSSHKLNVFDLNSRDPAAWMNGLQDILSWLEIVLGGLTAGERNVILAPAYERAMAEAGIIRDDPATWTRIPPRVSDLYEVLRVNERPAAQDLADRLYAVAMGVYRDAFDCQTNVDADAELVVFGLRDVHRDMQPIRMRQVMSYIWARVLTGFSPTLVIVDEAWRWLSQPGAAQDLSEMARRFRKHYAGLNLATQHGGDLSASVGATVIRDTAAAVVLFRHGASHAPGVARLFRLNELEMEELVGLNAGESILVMGPVHLPLYTPIPPDWYTVWTTHPEELAAMRRTMFSATLPVQPAQVSLSAEARN